MDSLWLIKIELRKIMTICDVKTSKFLSGNSFLLPVDIAGKKKKKKKERKEKETK